MRITEIALTNFRSFQSTQSIALAPVTLLFGPNSVGKSSVLMALFYIQQMLEKGQCDPQRIDALGEKHIGGFKSLVNGRDLAKRMVIKLTLDKSGSIGASYNQIVDLVGDDFGLPVDSPTADANRMAVEFHIAWSKAADMAYVACYKVWLDDSLIAELSSDAGLRQPVITWLNYRHPALLTESDHEEYAEADYVSRLHELLNANRKPETVSRTDIGQSAEIFFEHAVIGFKGFAGALPVPGKRLETVIEADEPTLNLRLHEILSDVLVAPLDNLLTLLNKSICIGPLRLIPDALHRPNPYPQQKDWYSGAAACDVTGRLTAANMVELNHWLNASSTLNLGYSLRLKRVISQSAYSEGGDTASELQSDQHSTGAKARQLATKQVYSKWVLWDDLNNIEVAFSEVGVGISQLYPLVVAAVKAGRGIIACEQPELHVHPRIQVGIGDLLTQADKNPTFLIETHSEHLILRILRRIRETSENNLPGGLQPVSPADVSIVYMEPCEAGVRTRRIEIDHTGEFTSRWPNGFFAERGEELF